MIRALSLDEIDFSDLVAVVWKEIRVAVLCGVCLAAANFVKMMVVDRWLMHNPEVTPLVALVVCLTLVFTVLCAKVVGCTLPMAAEKLGIDPAVMASPFITTIVDALSLLIYSSPPGSCPCKCAPCRPSDRRGFLYLERGTEQLGSSGGGGNGVS